LRTLVLGRSPLKANEIGLSIDFFPGVKRLEDLSEPWPLRDNHFDEIVSDSVLEPKDIELFLSECFRVLCSGGRIELLIKMETWQMKYAIIYGFKNIHWDDKEQKLTAEK